MILNKLRELKYQNPIWKITPLFFCALCRTILNRVSTFFWKLSGVKMGKGTIIQRGVSINSPKSITIGNNCLITTGVTINTEVFNKGSLTLGENVQINKGVKIDITGEVFIGNNSLISEGSYLYSHDHGYNPRSKPIGRKLYIGENVWIGSNCNILAQVGFIGNNSIIGTCSLVTREVSENSIFAGIPAKKIKSIEKENTSNSK